MGTESQRPTLAVAKAESLAEPVLVDQCEATFATTTQSTCVPRQLLRWGAGASTRSHAQLGPLPGTLARFYGVWVVDRRDLSTGASSAQIKPRSKDSNSTKQQQHKHNGQH